jgi:hypothetical protein
MFEHADEITAYDASRASRPTVLPVEKVYWGQETVHSFNETPGSPLSGKTPYEAAAMINSGENLWPTKVFERQPWMEDFPPMTYKGKFTGNWSTTLNDRIYTLNNRNYTASAIESTMENSRIRANGLRIEWPAWADIYWGYSHQFTVRNSGFEVLIPPSKIPFSIPRPRIE